VDGHAIPDGGDRRCKGIRRGMLGVVRACSRDQKHEWQKLMNLHEASD
jgi:hypothetical protein